MNKYTFIFVFRGKHYFFRMTANQLANSVIDHTDDVLDMCCEMEGQSFGAEFFDDKGDKYEVSFEKPGILNVYETIENDGNLLEENVPYRLLKIDNEDDGEIYNITDDI